MRTAFNWIPAPSGARGTSPRRTADSAANGIESELLHGGPNTPAVSQIIAGGGAEIGLASDELS